MLNSQDNFHADQILMTKILAFFLNGILAQTSLKLRPNFSNMMPSRLIGLYSSKFLANKLVEILESIDLEKAYLNS